jgi:hypothetical protein
MAIKPLFSAVYTALNYESSNMIFTAGTWIKKQLLTSFYRIAPAVRLNLWGAGRGGKMSPFAATVTRIVREHNLYGSFPLKIS